MHFSGSRSAAFGALGQCRIQQRYTRKSDPICLKHCKVHFILQLGIFGSLVIILLIIFSVLEVWCCGYLHISWWWVFFF